MKTVNKIITQLKVIIKDGDNATKICYKKSALFETNNAAAKPKSKIRLKKLSNFLFHSIDYNKLKKITHLLSFLLIKIKLSGTIT
ncbi:MAG: hypothetical protein R2798_13275 [Chitinophagales bacterium]|nr:hypothetical protein [Bacteroidota bacterium]MCB9044273.1 hypothetical protein [Chitinophagales bacterium]